jgi:hypothetical protein
MACAILLLSNAVVLADDSFENTLTVDADQSSSADYHEIQDAIDAVTNPSASNRWTILVYAGEYDEAITFEAHDSEAAKPYVELVGVDRDSVIIAPSEKTDAVTCHQYNTVRNLTIVATGDASATANGLILMDGCSALNLNIEVNADEDAGGVHAAIKTLVGSDDIRITDCTVAAPNHPGIGIWMQGSVASPAERVRITDCSALGGFVGIRLMYGDRILVENCRITGDNAAADLTEVAGLFVDRRSSGPLDLRTDVRAVGCTIRARGHASESGTREFPQTVGVRSDVDSYPQLIDCDIEATADKEAVFGVFSGAGSLNPNLIITGGSITTSCDDEKETDVWDLRRNDPDLQRTGTLPMSGTRCSKWLGPIEPALGARLVTQRVLDVAAADDDAIHPEYDLPSSEGEWVATNITNPDVYRVLTVTGNSSGMAQTVYVRGTDWADNPITDAIELDGTTTAIGRKPFMTVDKVFFPARTDSGQKVRIGTSTRLGLYYPVSEAGDVVQLSKMAISEQSFTVEQSVGEVDSDYSTVAVDITTGDSFEWLIEASE